MYIKQKIGVKYIKFVAIFIISLVITAIGFLGFRNMSSRAADSEIIDVSSFDFSNASSGNNWSYDPIGTDDLYSDFTITGPITFTGTRTTDADARNIRIVGEHAVTLDSLDLTVANNTMSASCVLRIEDSTDIILANTNTLTNATVPPELNNHSASGIIFGNNDQTTTNAISGGGTLNINIATTNSQISRGIESDIVFYFTGGSTINISIADNIHANNASSGISVPLQILVLTEKAKLNIDVGSSTYQATGIITKDILFDGGGSISIALSDNNTGETKVLKNSSGDITTVLSSRRYAWSVSDNYNGTPVALSGVGPTIEFQSTISDTNNYHNAKFMFREENSPVGATTITSPTTNKYVNSAKGFTISGTIVDKNDDDSWIVTVGLVSTESANPPMWTACTGLITTRDFSCQFSGFTTEGTGYLKVRVTDSPSNPDDPTTNIVTVPVIVDNTPPEAPTIDFHGSYVSGNVSDKPVYATIIHGADTNVDKTTYSLNDGPEIELQDITIPLLIRSSGIWDLKVFTYDKAGNKSPAATATVKVDLYPPSEPSIIFTSPTQITGWLNTNVVFHIVERQDDTGVVKNTYTIGTGSETEYDYSNIIVSDEGEIDITAKSYDGAGRVSSTTETVYIDKTAPTLSRNLSGGTQVDSSTYTVSPTITLAGADSLSGVKEIQYSWHNGAISAHNCTYDTITTDSSVDTQIPATYGLYSLCSRSVDNAGNVSQAALDYYALTDLRKVLIDPDTGISIETLGPEFLWHYSIKVIQKENDYYDFNTGKETLAIFSIEICSNLVEEGECTPIDYFQDALRVKIPASLYLNTYEDFKLIHIKDTGEQVEHPFEIIDGFIVFETGGLSDWAILGSLKPKSDNNDALGVPNTGSNILNNTAVVLSILATTCSAILVLVNIKAIKKSSK